MADERLLTFGPFTRAVTSMETHSAPAETMADGSVNMLVDPIVGGAFKRSGSAIRGGDTVTGATNRCVDGILESKPNYYPVSVRSFYSDALADGASGGSPTYSALFAREAQYTNWPIRDTGVFGTEYVRRTNANYSLLSEFGSTAYPTGGGAHGGVAIKYIVQPFWYESGEGGYSRGAFEFARRFVAAGSYRTIDAGRWRYYGNLRGTPIRWDGGCNDNASTISNAIRVAPTGPFAPLWAPTVALNGGAAGGREAGFPWVSGDTFYLSVMYQFEDGSYSLPVMPRDVNATLTSGLGFVTVGTIGGGQHYTSLTYENIPRGPNGTIARILLRSKKQTRTASTDALTIDISDLRILGVLRNNTQTSYVDTLSDDDGLLQDTDIVRWDLICPPRSRYLGTGDQRVIAGYTLPNPSAIQLTCASIGNPASAYDQNVEDTNTTATGATSAVYRVTSTALELALANGGTTLDAGLSTIVQLDWATYPTLQQLVDAINATAYAAGPPRKGLWKAQIAPGADPSANSDTLCPTVLTVANCTDGGSSTLTTATSAGFAPVPIGYKCYASAGITAGTYVTQKNNAAQDNMTLSQANTAAGVTVTFYADCGDEACVTTAGSKGWIRVHGSSYPGMIYFKRSALPGYDRPNKDRIYFTISSPGAAATGVNVAANAWGAANRRDGVNQPGQIMGIADVQGAAVICYRDKIALFVNERGSNTGEDFDYRIQTINNSIGCISPWSVVEAAGCAVYATSVGIKAADKSRREVRISGDIYQPVRNKGDLAYEVPICVGLAGSDSPSAGWLAGAAFGNRLIYSYRRSASTYGFSVYDFSKGVDQLGLDALADPESRRPYGWSSMCLLDYGNDIFGPQAMGAVKASGGLKLYAAINDTGGTANGRIDELFTGSTDNGATIVGQVITKRYIVEPGTKLSAQAVTTVHKSSYTGPQVAFSRLENGTVGSYITVTNSGGNDVLTERLQLPQDHRSPASVAQLVWYDGSSSTGALVWQLTLGVEVLRKVGT